MKKKKLYCKYLLCVIFALLLSACSDKGGESANSGTEVFTISEMEKPATGEHVTDDNKIAAIEAKEDISNENEKDSGADKDKKTDTEELLTENSETKVLPSDTGKDDASLNDEPVKTKEEDSSNTKESLKSSDAVQKEDNSPQKEEASEIKAPSNSGKLHVDGTKIKNENGEDVVLTGVSTHGLAWFPDYVNDDLFAELRNEWGCNLVRLAMYTAESGGYCTDGNKENLIKIVERGVDFATNNDMYVIIDWHILSDNNPNINKDAAKDFFAKMAEKYQNYKNVIYEICNEPNGSTSWKDIKSYAEEVIPVIRKYSKDSIIIVGTPNWSQFVDKAANDPITGYDNIMYALHFYADTHKEDLRRTASSAIKMGLPVFITEYSICDASGNGNINEDEAAKWVDLMNEYSISSAMWNLANKNETSSLIASYCKKTSGFEYDDLSSTGKWLYDRLKGVNKANSSEKKTEGKTEDKKNDSPKIADKDAKKKDVADSAIVIKKEDVKYAFVLSNSWEGANGTYYQYELTVVNDSKDEINGWKAEFSFSDSIEVEDGWCANYKADGSKLTISNVDYNGKISKGGSTKDIGFIIVGSPNLKLITQ